MSRAPKVRSMNVTESETRSGLGQNANKPGRLLASDKQVSNTLKKIYKSPDGNKKGGEERRTPPSAGEKLTPIVSKSNQARLMKSTYSMNASCSSDASSDSFHSRASTGRIHRSNSVGESGRNECKLKTRSLSGTDNVSVSSVDDLSPTIKRCAWVTSNTDLAYAAFHDEEWGVPEHDDKKLFELLALSAAQAELTWPAILSKRRIFREVFLGFDPTAVAKLNEKRFVAPGSIASSLLSELRLRSIVQNAVQITKVIEDFGSFDKYIWSFVNNKPIINNFKYPRQVLVKTSKADAISKDLVRRGFRSVGPTVVYSFMQASGITNDHLVSCYRFQDCIAAAAAESKDFTNSFDTKKKKTNNGFKPEPPTSKAIDELRISSE